MAVKKISIKPGFMSTMRKAMLTKDPLVTSDLRKGFLERPFWKQAVCIGFYAKEQLRSINDLISEKRIKGVTAVKIWKLIGEDKSPHENHEKIKRLFPLLANESSRIAQALASTYTFWVDRFYSCDKFGRSDAETSIMSKALKFKAEEIARINKNARMPELGENMKRYAEFLRMPSD